MSDLHEIAKRDWTFEKRLGWKNTEDRPISQENAARIGKPELASVVFPYYTKNGVVSIFPDHWAEGSDQFERIPDDIEAVEYDY